MEGDEDAVGRDVEVGLEVAVAERDGGGEGGQRVLGVGFRVAAMGERDGARVVEEGMDGAQRSQRTRSPARRFTASAEIASRAARLAIIAVASAQS